MCGIFGVVNFDGTSPDEKVIYEILNTLNHRGPDNKGIKKIGNTVLGHTRLSIIDLSIAANQPFSDPSGNYTIVFNGEIYNYKEIRKELEQGGVFFLTNSDTEVLLQLYIRYSEKCLQHLNGMFAFAIVDRAKDEIFIARDRAGKKPLFYSVDDHRLIFSSEIKPFFSIHDFMDNISIKGLLQYLALGYTIAPDTVFSKIKKLQSAHYLKVNLHDGFGSLAPFRYWAVDFSSTPKIKDIDSAGNEFDSLFRDSIEKRLNSDVPLAVYLSGGLDSSAILSVLASSRDETVHAFTVDFGKGFSELPTAKATVNKYQNVKHHVVNFSLDEMKNHRSFFQNMDEPFSDSSVLPTYWISRLLKDEGFTVALAGDGGDELLAGYLANKNFPLLDFIQSGLCLHNFSSIFGFRIIEMGGYPDTRFADYFRRVFLTHTQYYWYTRMSIKPHEFRHIFSKSFCHKMPENLFEIFPDIGGSNAFSIFETGDFNFRLTDGYLTKTDRASMQNSVELRNPFLDYRLIEFLARIDQGLKINNGVTKFILREYLASRALVPAEVLQQKKMGFSIPLRELVHFELKDQIMDVISQSTLSKYMGNNVLAKLFNLGKSGSMHNKYTETIWRLYVLAIYLEDNKIELSI